MNVTKMVIKSLQDCAVLQIMVFGLIVSAVLRILCCVYLSKITSQLTLVKVLENPKWLPFETNYYY